MEVEILVQAVLVTHEDVLQARNTSPGQMNKIWNVRWLLNKQMYHLRVCSLGCLYITTHHPVTVLRILVQLLISYRIIPGVQTFETSETIHFIYLHPCQSNGWKILPLYSNMFNNNNSIQLHMNSLQFNYYLYLLKFLCSYNSPISYVCLYF